MKLPSIFSGNRSVIFFRLVVNGMAQALTTIGTILIVRMAFDRFIIKNQDIKFNLMLQVGLGLVFIAICIGWLRMVERIDAEKVGQSYIHQIRMLLFKHLSVLTPRALQQRSRGAIVLRFIGDLNALKRWVSLGMVRITVAGITTVCALLALSALNWKLAAVVAVVLCLGTIYAVGIGKHIRETVKESRRRRAYLAANVNEKVATIAVVQIFGQTSRERRRVKRQSERLTGALVARARKIGLIRGLTQSTTALASGAVLLMGAFEVHTGQTTPGTVVAAMTIVGLLVPALRDLSRVYEYWQESKVSSDKIIGFLKTSSLVKNKPGAPDLKSGPGRLEFRNVSLGRMLRDITVTAEAGRMIVIVGSNGAGKSTLLSTAALLIGVDNGKILLDGQDIAACSLKSVRRNISMVSPDLPLLRGTVRKNLLYRLPKASDEEISRVWNLCGIHDVLAELPEGEDTRVTEEGHSLSLGQRQRIGLARAILGNPRILLLDEADAHLDAEAGISLKRILAEYKGTILWVTHNPDRLAGADYIWRIENGCLVDVTTPRQLQKLTG